jgi:hypothetical protein
MPRAVRKLALGLLLLGLSGAAAWAAPEKRVALVIGNSAYTGIQAVVD